MMNGNREDAAEAARLDAEAQADDGFVSCEWCGGRFDRSDMAGEHCHACADELAEGDA